MSEATIKKIKFTKQQLLDWRCFEEVRSSGQWNMYDPRARQASGLSQEEYIFVTKHYSALKADQPAGEKK